MLANTGFLFFNIEFPDRILAMVVGFILLVIVVMKMPPSIPLGIPFLRTTLSDRQQRIQEAHDQVARALADVKKLHDDYDARLKRIEEEAKHRIDEAVREAEIAHDEIIAEARESARALVRRSEEELSRERTRFRIQLRQQIVQITLDAAEHAVREHSSDSVQRALIGEFITRAAGNGQRAATEAAPTAATVTAAEPKGA